MSIMITKAPVIIIQQEEDNPDSILGKFTSLDLEITDETRVLEEPDNYMPWIALSLSNDGPDAIYVNINQDAPDETGPIAVGEQFSVNMGKRLIRKVLIFCHSGGHASVRLKARS